MNTNPLSASSFQNAEVISALVDGELSREELASAPDQWCSGEALSEWSAYHLIGEVLRSPASAVLGADMAFLNRLQARLAYEPAVAVDRRPAAAEASPRQNEAPSAVSVRPPEQAANDATFRWKMVAGFASFAAVAALGWNVSGSLSPAGSPQVAQATPAQAIPAQPAVQQVVVASPRGPVVRDARLEELRAAHRQLGGLSALQTPSGFLQNADFEMPQDARR